MLPKTFRLRIRTLLTAAACGLPAALQAATYYVSPQGSDSHLCDQASSSASAKATFASAWNCLAAGDTLIVRDGAYAQDITPPAGTAGAPGNPITVKAETDGKAVIAGVARLLDNSYIAFQGLKMKGPSGKSVFSVRSNDTYASASHHITLQRMALECPLTGDAVNDSACVSLSGGAHDNLIEDSWIWGGGRYAVLVYGRNSSGGSTGVTGADHNTFRRLVLRMGPNRSKGGNPQAAMSLYYANDTLVENVLALDCVAGSDNSNAAFYITSHAPPPAAQGNRFLGVIALNTTGAAARQPAGLYLDVDNGGNSSLTEVRDSVFWANGGTGIQFYNQNAHLSTGTVVRHVTSGRNGRHGYQNFTAGVSVRSSLFVDNGGFGLRNGSAGSTWEDHNLLYGNASGAREKIAPGAKDIAAAPRLSYIGRVEPGTPCDNKGEGGADCGADLAGRYVDGVKTSDPLWPWPNQARIQSDMCAGETRGFCGKASVTEYVWTYLGAPNPYPDR